MSISIMSKPALKKAKAKKLPVRKKPKKATKNASGKSFKVCSGWVNEEYAIEFDFADKWAEAIAQSLYYAMRLNKKAAIVLIIEDEKEQRFWFRMNAVIEEYKLPIKTYLFWAGEVWRSPAMREAKTGHGGGELIDDCRYADRTMSSL